MMGKMDPYLIVEYARAGETIVRKFRSQTHKAGHKTPKWDWECQYLVYGCSPVVGDTIKLVVMEEDITSSELVGESSAQNISTLT
jgi:hypothetical protein